MDIIRKKICFESARTRQQGLLPYIRRTDLYSQESANTICYEDICKTNLITGERTTETVVVTNKKVGTSDFSYVTLSDKDGNYGNFVCNPYISSGVGAELFGVGYVNYMDIMYRYNKIHNLLFDGLKLKRVNVHNKVYYVTKFEDAVTLYDYSVVDGSNLIEVSKDRYAADDETIVYETTIEIDKCGVEKVVKKATKKKTQIDFGQFVNCIDEYKELESLCQFFGGIDNIYKFCHFVEDNFIGILPIPAEITGDSVPEFLYYSDIKEWYDWFKLHEGDTNCCIKETWKKRGGDAMYAFLRGHLDTLKNALANAKTFFKEDDLGRHIPKINVSLSLISKHDDIGIITNYIDPDVDYTYSGFTDDIRISGGTANSRLQSLISPRLSHDDAGTALPGIFNTNEKLMCYRCKPIRQGTLEVVGWKWEKSKLGVGELDSANSVLLTIPPTFLSVPRCGEESYEIYKEDHPELSFCETDVILISHMPELDIPFTKVTDASGYVINMEYAKYYDADGVEYINVKDIPVGNGSSICCEMIGDYITNIETSHDNDKIKFNYTIQGHFWATVTKHNDTRDKKTFGIGTRLTNNFDSYSLQFVKEIDGTGFKYEEEYDYYPYKEVGPYLFNEVATRDCKDQSDPLLPGDFAERNVKLNYIDFESAKVRIRHQELGLEREGLLATIVDYAAGDVWREGLFCISAIPFENKSILKDKDIKTLDNPKIKELVQTLDGHRRESIKTPIYKEEALNGIKADINVKVNFSVNRGLAAAKEMHYKLSECNTLEDMENYGNNYFNIQ